MSVPASLAWVDDYVARVRPYVFVREVDRLLIKRPNEAHKLNATGAKILKALLDGVTIGDVVEAVGRDGRRVEDVALFLREIRRAIDGEIEEFGCSRAVEVQPFELGFSKLPVLSEIALTYRCNLRCSFCYAGCNCTTNPVGDGREMTRGEIERVLRRIREEGQVPTVSFTGGEPALRSELCDLVAYAKRLDMRVNVITNGTRVTDELAQDLAVAGLDSAQVSLEGVSAERHDSITGVVGAFWKTLEGLGRLRDAGIRVHTNTTLNRHNLDDCRRMPRFVAERLGLPRFSMNLVIPTGSADLNDDLVVRYDEVGEHLSAIKDESERVGVEFLWYSPTPMCLFNPIARGLGNKGCAACDGLISVAANGDVLPCSSYDEPVGNLLREGVEAVWGSRLARRHRDKSLAHPDCRSCEDFAACQGACPLYWRRLGFGELCNAQGFDPVDMEHFRS
jgi:radical SAM protein with 4Fe4S-binding SPASM domain